MNENKAQIAIIGGGIIGVSCAVELLNKGYAVTLFDMAEPGAKGSSRGNAGQIVPAEIIPLACPGISKTAVKMLLDSNAPLKIPLSQWPRLSPWLWQFLQHSQANKFAENIQYLAELNKTVWQDSNKLFSLVGCCDLLQNQGGMSLYQDPKKFRASQQSWVLRQYHEKGIRQLEQAEIYEIEPSLAKNKFTQGYFIPSIGQVANPKLVVDKLFNYALQFGLDYRCEQITHILPSENSIKLNTFVGNSQRFDKVVLAAGVWSKKLAKQMGDKVSVTSERGYNLTYCNTSSELRCPLIFPEHGVVATQIDNGLRLGGWAELCAHTKPASRQYFIKIDNIAKSIFPELKQYNQSNSYRWVGARPSTPNSCPIITRSKACNNVVYAFGHGHLGLTQAATTAKMVLELINFPKKDSNAG